MPKQGKYSTCICFATEGYQKSALPLAVEEGSQLSRSGFSCIQPGQAVLGGCCNKDLATLDPSEARVTSGRSRTNGEI